MAAAKIDLATQSVLNTNTLEVSHVQLFLSWHDLSFRQGMPEPSHREVKVGLQTIPGSGFRHSLPE